MLDICVIPARGGSRRIPGKNKRLFCGQPMLVWSIQAAQKAGCFQRIIVSTDDPQIAALAQAHGAEIPFARPSYLADDHTGTREVLVHAIECLDAEGCSLHAVCCLYATAPFVLPEDLLKARERMLVSRLDTVVFAATSFPFPIQRAIRLDQEGYASAINPHDAEQRSQDLEEAFHDAGQFYWATPSAWRQPGNLFDGARPLILPRWRVQDIDTEEDWKRAELMHPIVMQELANA